MKKIFLSFMLVVLALTLIACGGGKDEKETYTVTFNTDGGSNVASKKVEKGAKLTKPTDPNKNGFAFDGWYKDAGFTDDWDFEIDVVEQNITLYAKFVVPSIAVSELEKYIKSTKSNYQDSPSGNILITIKDGDATSTLEYIYNYGSSEINSLMLKYVSGDTAMEAYVKDGWDYVNIAGEKTKAPVGYDTTEAILEQYGFNQMTEAVFNALDANIFNASEVIKDENGVATLKWNKDRFENVIDESDPDKLFEILERIEQIKENINSININITYANKKVTKIESTWVNANNVTKLLNIEFRGLDTQTITYPSDLGSYINR